MINQHTMPMNERGGTTSSINMSQNERGVATISGIAMLLLAITKPRKYGLLLGPIGASLLYQGLMGYSYLYDLVGRNSAVHRKSAAISVPHEQGIRVVQGITIKRPVAEVYDFWRDFQNLPRFMNHVESVTVQSPTMSHWRVTGPLNISVEWDAEIVNDEENSVIGWRTLENPYVDHAGSVQFKEASGDRGTDIRVEMEYIPTGGRVGAAIASIFGTSPERQVWEDLHRLKQHMENGQS